jgi:hypothetical protein
MRLPDRDIGVALRVLGREMLAHRAPRRTKSITEDGICDELARI